MIKVEGYKAFRGILTIAPPKMPEAKKEMKGDWLYKPEEDCWYGCGNSYPAEMCTVTLDEEE